MPAFLGMMRPNTCEAWPDPSKETGQEEETMAEAIQSSAEHTLENQRLGPLQIRVAALCTLVQICDGYDINSIGMAVSSSSVRALDSRSESSQRAGVTPVAAVNRRRNVRSLIPASSARTATG